MGVVVRRWARRHGAGPPMITVSQPGDCRRSASAGRSPPVGGGHRIRGRCTGGRRAGSWWRDTGNIASFIVVGADHVRARVPSGDSDHIGPGLRRPVLLPDGARSAQLPSHCVRDPDGHPQPIRAHRLSRLRLAGGGRAELLVPWSLVIMNVVGLAVWVRSARRSPGMPVDIRVGACCSRATSGSCGYLSRDLAEIVTATFVVAGVVALRRERLVSAGAAFSVGVLSRETALVVVGLAGGAATLVVARGTGLRPTPARSARVGSGTAAVDGRTPVISWVLPGRGLRRVAARGPARHRVVAAAHVRPAQPGRPLRGIVRGFRHYPASSPSRAAAAVVRRSCFILVVVVVGGCSPGAADDSGPALRTGGLDRLRHPGREPGAGDMAGRCRLSQPRRPLRVQLHHLVVVTAATDGPGGARGGSVGGRCRRAGQIHLSTSGGCVGQSTSAEAQGERSSLG